MRDIIGYICLVLFVFAAVAAVLAAARPGLFSRRRAAAAAGPPATPPAGELASPGTGPETAPLATAAAPLAMPAPPVEGVAPAATPAPAFTAAPALPPDAATALTPAPATAPAPAQRSVPLIATLSGVAVVCAALTYVLLLMPVYSVEVVPPEQVVAAPGSIVPVEVTNGGALGGTYEAEPTLDGGAIASVSGEVSAGDATLVDVVLPDDLSAGAHTLAVGDVEYRFTALTPPDYKVGRLKVEPAVVKPKQEVTVTVTVKNRGEATGDYPGTLDAGGKEVGAAETEIAGGESETVRVQLHAREARQGEAGDRRLEGVADGRQAVRPANGAVLANSLAGGGNLMVFQNRYPEDAMFCLTTSKSSRKPTLVVYVRGKKIDDVNGLRDGSYCGLLLDRRGLEQLHRRLPGLVWPGAVRVAVRSADALVDVTVGRLRRTHDLHHAVHAEHALHDHDRWRRQRQGGKGGRGVGRAFPAP